MLVFFTLAHLCVWMCALYIRDMKLGSGSDGLSRRAFLESMEIGIWYQQHSDCFIFANFTGYLVARADIMNEEEKLESKKYFQFSSFFLPLKILISIKMCYWHRYDEGR